MSYTLSFIGSSEYTDYEELHGILKSIKRPAKFITGDAGGAEELALQICELLNIPCETISDVNGDKCRLKVNNKLVESGDALLAFWDSESKAGIFGINSAIYLGKYAKIHPTAFATKDIANKEPGFVGNYRWLSNFWPCEIAFGEYVFASSEAAYQAAKFRSRPDIVRKFVRIPAKKAKELCKQFTVDKNFDEEAKLDVMRKIVYQKFKQNRYLQYKLVMTGKKTLQEINSWGDVFWGVCNGVGKNHLGKILMEVREIFAEQIKLEKENKLSKLDEDKL